MADLKLTFKKPHIALRPFDHLDYPLLSGTSLDHFDQPDTRYCEKHNLMYYKNTKLLVKAS